MDPISQALAKSGISAAIKSATELMNKLFGPAAEEAGLFLGDKVRTYRLRNMLKTLGKTQEMLNKAGIEPDSVPLRTLIPLIQGASIEDDDKLSTRWAALLANAAISRHGAFSSQIFSNILSQLSPVDTLIFDKLSTGEHHFKNHPQLKEYISFRLSIIRDLGLNEAEYDLSVDNLVRLGLCVTNPRRLSKGLEESMRKLDPQLVRRDILVMTKLGQAFMKACSPPISTNT